MGFFDSLLNSALDKASEKAAKATVNSIMGGGKKQEIAVTPPPPPVPQAVKSLSVMVAVNGESYGPYERATLLEMINKGSLTRETYVFIQGMDGWKAAGNVPEVAELFSSHAPTPAAPPVPWDDPMKNVPSAPKQFDNGLSDKLNALITSAVADGEISDLERQVLIRNAQQEGVAMDEFVMVLEARLYEQRQLLQRQVAEQRRADAAAMAAAAPAAAPQPIPSQDEAKPTKCPSCGAPIKSLATRCPECGAEYTHNGKTATAWAQLYAKLQEIDNRPKSKSFWGSLNEKDDDTLKAQAITNFPVPSNREDLLEFFLNCASQIKSSHFNVKKAYHTKAQQVLIKSRIVLKDDPSLLNEIESIAKQYKIK